MFVIILFKNCLYKKKKFVKIFMISGIEENEMILYLI